ADEAEAAVNASGLTLRNQERLLEQKALAESVYLDTKYRHDINLARHQQAQTYLSKTVIRAPISGVVDSRNLEVGELATPGREFVDLVEIDRVKIVAGVPERHLKHVTDGTRATLTFPAYPDVTLEADISYIGTTLDPDSRTVPVEITLDNPAHRLKPEMAVTIRVVKDNIPAAIVIPQDAVIDTDQGRIVFLADRNVARSVPVELGSTSGDQVLVTNGLATGDTLIVVGHRNLVNGETIQVRNEGM
ncbi:MAG: efflux RND transporter periplasmic adaptor subunit, partial [Gemmatimonadota bacterium]|nr:efflux RND transporter periplasmic adaptor subunit [Gemmatimonadota bacterium]